MSNKVSWKREFGGKKVKNATEFAHRCEEYFEWCKENKHTPKFVGLARACGISKQSLSTYKNKQFYGPYWRAAQTYIEEMNTYLLDHAQTATGGFRYLQIIGAADPDNLTIKGKQTHRIEVVGVASPWRKKDVKSQHKEPIAHEVNPDVKDVVPITKATSHAHRNS